jgi:RNA polymerase sigma-70 factor (ECF subfamily)
MLDRQTAEPSDAELLRRIAQRDHAAMGELYDRVADVLFGTAIHILGDRREAEEVVQDVFLQVWNKAATFDGALGTAFNWTIGITRNRCIDYLRSRQRRARLLDEAIEEAGGESPASAPTTGMSLGAEELAAVRHAVESLPPDQHQAIAMAFFGGMTHQEIADALNEPLGTIKARIRRGMLKLRDSLEAYL